MAAIATVTDIITEARRLLADSEDNGGGYRYSDEVLLTGLNIALLEARRLRPDMFLNSPSITPSYSAVDSTAVDIDQQYRMAVVSFITGHANLQDVEDTQDARAVALITQFRQMLGAG